MAIIITIDGPDQVLHLGINAFSRNHGWQDQVEQNGQMVDNPVSQLDFSKEVLRNFFGTSIKQWNVIQAQLSAGTMAEQQTASALQNITLSVDEE